MKTQDQRGAAAGPGGRGARRVVLAGPIGDGPGAGRRLHATGWRRLPTWRPRCRPEPRSRWSRTGRRTPVRRPARPRRDWLRSSGKTQLAAAFAESLWQSRELDLLVWIQATSRASVLSGYAAATAAATGRDQASSCESVAAQFLSWLGETSRPGWSSSMTWPIRRTWTASGRPARPAGSW